MKTSKPSSVMLQTRRAVLMGIGGSMISGTAMAQFGLKLGGGDGGGINLDLGRIISSATNLFEGLTLGEEDEKRIGEEMYGKMVDRSGGQYRNRKAQAALERFTAPLIEQSSRPFTWEVTLLNNNAVNAWALPGGKVAVNKGLLRYVKNEDELAAVLAHEIGHAELSHGLSKMRSEAFTKGLTDGGRAALSASVDGAGGRFQEMALDAFEEPLHNMLLSGYSRDAEEEADLHILDLFGKTGFDPTRASGFFETLIGLAPPESEATTSLFSTHPGTKARIEAIDKVAAKMSPVEVAHKSEEDWALIKKRFPTRKKKPKAIGAKASASKQKKKEEKKPLINPLSIFQ